MSAHKHTPGPWTWDWHQVEGEADCGVRSELKAGHAFSVCRAPRYQTQKQWEDDARLIAAAPDSYEANRKFIAAANSVWNIKPHHDDDYIYDEMGSELAAAYFAARAAIGRATGELA